MPFHFFLQPGSYPSCPLNCSLNGSKLISPDDKVIPFWTGSGLFDLIHRLHLLGIIFQLGAINLYDTIYIWGNPWLGSQYSVHSNFFHVPGQISTIARASSTVKILHSIHITIYVCLYIFSVTDTLYIVLYSVHCCTTILFQMKKNSLYRVVCILCSSWILLSYVHIHKLR